MEELYRKVASDSNLQTKLADILKEAEKEGKDATIEKLSVFAKDAGYDIKLEEMQSFIKELMDNDNGALSDVELDMVAGGKSGGAISNILTSVFSLGIACAIASGMAYNTGEGDACKEMFQ
jgi:hypothetical protein